MRLLPLLLLAGVIAACDDGYRPRRSSADVRALIDGMYISAAYWNSGDLGRYMASYDRLSTYMTPSGPIRPGQLAIRNRLRYFSDRVPERSLRFEGIDARPIGERHVLMTGRYILTGEGVPEESGIFSLVWVNTRNGWRIVHHHAS